jgi:plastocyanin
MRRTRSLRGLSTAVACLTLMLGVAACSSDGSSSTGSSTEPVKVNITEQGGKIQPVGQVVKAGTGQDITLVVTSDVKDEIHVHTDPEHEFEVKAGDQDKEFTFSVDTPGQYEVESHRLDVTLLKLQVS